jgi:hypothetical protein
MRLLQPRPPRALRQGPIRRDDFYSSERRGATPETRDISDTRHPQNPGYGTKRDNREDLFGRDEPLVPDQGTARAQYARYRH